MYCTLVIKDNKFLRSHIAVEIKDFLIFWLLEGTIRSRIWIRIRTNNYGSVSGRSKTYGSYGSESGIMFAFSTTSIQNSRTPNITQYIYNIQI
jgi:hypothetical protein